MTLHLVEWAVLAAGLAAAVLRVSVPIVFAAIGGLLSDLAGSINVALEGLMLIAAFFGVIVSIHAAQWFPGLPTWALPWVGAAAGVAASLLLAGLLAVCHLELGADLIIAGIAINILAAGLTVFLLVSIAGDKGSTAGLRSYALPSVHLPGLSGIPPLNILLNGETGEGYHILLYAAGFFVVAVSLFLSRMRYGVWIRAVGENREAARSAGIPIKNVQYLALLASGFFCGLGGVYLSMGYLTLFQADMTGGRGFLALAAIFFGARRVWGTCAAAMLFGASTVLTAQIGTLHIPPQITFMLPPLLTIFLLCLAGKRAKLAKAKGTI